MAETAGRTCPLRYRYGAAALAKSPLMACERLWVVGGLYGNPFALDAIERMVSEEQGHARICFNGDFNWFNRSAADFNDINQQVLQHDCVLGNVEAELGEPLDAADCGCSYPEHVDQGVVDRSNTIHTELKRIAQAQPDLLSRIAERPFYARYQVGGLKVAVVHGDADSLSGWRFDPAHLNNTDERQWRVDAFEKAQVDLFASSHTCSAAFHREPLPGGRLGLISNNGAAGMPSVAGSLDGLVTRVSTEPYARAERVANKAKLNGVWVEQIRVQYPQEDWLKHFTSLWPEGSAAHESYFKRISQGE